MKSNLINKQDDWQFYANLSREAIVTNENLFNLIYISNDTTNKSYKTLLDKNNLRSVSSNAEGAQLQHDIILINSDLYNILDVTYSTSIYTDEDEFLSNAIALANPVYDARAAFKYITLYNPEKANSIRIGDLAKQWENFSYYTEEEEDKKVYKTNKENRYKIYATKLANWLTSSLSEVDGAFKDKNKATFTIDMTIANCKALLTDSGQIAFDKLLSLHFHDKDSVKMPYAPVKADVKQSNVRKMRTRFLMNLIPTVVTHTSYSISYNWLESLSLLDEDNIDSYINEGQPSISNALNDSRFKDASKSLKNGLSAIISRQSSLSLSGVLCDASTQVYCGVEAPEQTITAISLVDSEDTAIGNIFKNESNTALKFYKRIKITNAYSDIILYLRNPWYRMSMAPKDAANSSLSWSIPTCLSEYVYDNSTNNISFNVLPDDNAVSLSDDIIFKNLILYTLLCGGYSEDDAYAILYKYLANETILFKAPYFGDFIEKANFEQDLTEDSSVTFEHSEIKRTDDPSTRNNDAQSTVETLAYPYLQQTSSLIDSVRFSNSDDVLSKEGYDRYVFSPNETEFKYFSHSLSAKSIDGKSDIIPPIFFDIDAEADKTQAYYASFFYNTTKPQLNLENGSLNVEGRLTAPVIDDIWKYFKYLTESTDEDILPEFKGLFASALIATNGNGLADTTLRSTTDRAFKKSTRKNNTELGSNVKYDNSVIDILRWHPYQSSDNGIKELINGQLTIANYTGYKIDEALYKPVDYQVKFFGRRKNTTYAKNGDIASNGSSNGYEFEDDQSGYLEPVLDSINTSFKFEADPEYGNPSYAIAYDSTQRRAAYKALNRIVSFGSNNDGDNALARHFNYKQYKDHPKNLRVLEKNLEEIRENLMAFAEFVNATFAKQGYADAAQNRGTLYQLHRNYFISEHNDSDYSFLKDNKESIDLTKEDLTYANGFDRVVNYDDGIFSDRYKHDNYNQKELVYTDTLKASRKSIVDRSIASPYNAYKANQARLSEIYLAADGTWRYVGEHIRAPLLKCKY